MLIGGQVAYNRRKNNRHLINSLTHFKAFIKKDFIEAQVNPLLNQ